MPEGTGGVKALTFSPLRAWAVFHATPRLDVECRDLRISHRGRLLVHAARSITPKQYGDAALVMYEKLGIVAPELEDLPRGVIVGAVTVTDCVSASKSKWFEKGRFGLVLAYPKLAPKLVRCGGKQGIFDVPRDVANELKEAAA